MDPTDPPYRRATAATAFGVPLEPGERVILVSRRNVRQRLVFRWLIPGAICLPVCGVLLAVTAPGVLMTATLLGVFALVFAVGPLLETFATRCVVVTSRRVMLLARSRAPRMMLVADVGDLEAVGRTSDARSLTELAVRALESYAAAQNPKTTVEYWERAAGIKLISMSSSLTVPTEDAMTMGPFLTRCALEPGFAEKAPEVPFDP